MEFKMRRRFDHVCLPMYRLNWLRSTAASRSAMRRLLGVAAAALGSASSALAVPPPEKAQGQPPAPLPLLEPSPESLDLRAELEAAQRTIVAHQNEIGSLMRTLAPRAKPKSSGRAPSPPSHVAGRLFPARVSFAAGDGKRRPAT